MKIYGYQEYGHGHYLLFDKEVLATLPQPSNCEGDWLDAEIFDVLTGITWQAKMPAIFYEYSKSEHYDNASCDFVECESLDMHFYTNHWCGCHRAGDIENTNCTTINLGGQDECPRERFFIKKLTHRSRPDLILYHENYPAS